MIIYVIQCFKYLLLLNYVILVIPVEQCERHAGYSLTPYVNCRDASVFFQIRVDGSSRAQQYETVQAVENGPILRDMAFSSDHHYLYVMSETQVRPAHSQTHTDTLSPYHNHWHLSFSRVTGYSNLWCSVEDFITALLVERKGLGRPLAAVTKSFYRNGLRGESWSE